RGAVPRAVAAARSVPSGPVRAGCARSVRVRLRAYELFDASGRTCPRAPGPATKRADRSEKEATSQRKVTSRERSVRGPTAARGPLQPRPRPLPHCAERYTDQIAVSSGTASFMTRTELPDATPPSPRGSGPITEEQGLS